MSSKNAGPRHGASLGKQVASNAMNSWKVIGLHYHIAQGRSGETGTVTLVNRKII